MIRPLNITNILSASEKISSRSAEIKKHAAAQIPHRNQLLVYEFYGADIDAPGGLVGDDYLAAPRQFPRQDDFLLVAARERLSRSLGGTAPLMSYSSIMLWVNEMAFFLSSVKPFPNFS